MASLSSPGIGSGIDVRSIVEQLMSIEQQPLVRLQTREVELQAQISAYGALKSSISTFRDAIAKLSDPAKFKVYSATPSDATVVAASAGSTAAKGVYNLQINRIAENHRLASSTTFANTDAAVVGVPGDTLTITVGGSGFTLAIGGKTLGAIRDEINAAAANTGVTASILKDDVGYRLSLSANDTGSSHALAVSYSGADPFALQTLNLDRDQSGGFTNADLNASVQLEGQFNITSSSNSLTEAIEGVTITLKKAGTVTLAVDRDTAAVQKTVQDFAKAYSDLNQTIDKMRGDVLRSDTSSLLNIQAQLRSVLNSDAATGGSFSNIFELGISTQKNGTLTIDTAVLTSALNSDFEAVADLFADPGSGLAVQFRSLADSFLATGGPLDSRSEGLDNEVRNLGSRKDQLEERLRLIELRYTSQYNALDTIVSQLQSTGDLLTRQLDLLSANGNGSN